MNIIAVDPGKMWGIAQYVSSLEPERQFLSYEATPADGLMSAFSWLSCWHPALLVVERFTSISSNRMTHQPDAQEAVGQLKALAARFSDVEISIQDVASAKRMTTDARLKQLGWHQRTPDEHANDATRHLLLALATHDREEYARLIGI